MYGYRQRVAWFIRSGNDEGAQFRAGAFGHRDEETIHNGPPVYSGRSAEVHHEGDGRFVHGNRGAADGHLVYFLPRRKRMCRPDTSW